MAELFKCAGNTILRHVFADAEGGGSFTMTLTINETEQNGIAIRFAEMFQRFIQDRLNALPSMVGRG